MTRFKWRIGSAMNITSVPCSLAILPKVGQVADEFGIGLHGEPIAAAVVEEALHVEAHARIALQPAREFEAAGIVAGDDGAAAVEGVDQEPAHEFLHGQGGRDERHRRHGRPDQEHPARIRLQRGLS
jgi:hypothetical protein